MKSSKETSFKARLGRAQDLVTYIKGFANFAPTRTEDRIESMTTLVTDLLATNDLVAKISERYKNAVDMRQAAFEGGDESVQKLLVQIRAAVESQYGRKSTNAVVLGRIIKNMRAVKITKAPKDITNENEEISSRKTETSFMAVTQYFNEIISTLDNFTDYATSNVRVQKESLVATAARITGLNEEIARRIQELKSARTQRNGLYDELKERTLRIKTYVKGQYGMKSDEYSLIKSMKF